MKAVVYERYGGPEVLRVEDVPTPSPDEGQVLVKIAATSINLSDWEGLRGSPFYARLGGLHAPRRRTLGSDIAGVVHAVGSGVTQFHPGDEVYGDNLQLMGGFAEYAVARESALALKPAELTFAEASTIPQAGPIALQGTAGATRGSGSSSTGRAVGPVHSPFSWRNVWKHTSLEWTTPTSWSSCLALAPIRWSTTAATTSPGILSRTTSSWTSWPIGRSSPIVERSLPAAGTDVWAGPSERCSGCSRSAPPPGL